MAPSVTSKLENDLDFQLALEKRNSIQAEAGIRFNSELGLAKVFMVHMKL